MSDAAGPEAKPEIKITLTSEITVKLVDSMGGDLSIVRAARVSTMGARAEADPENESPKAQAGLINFLMKHRHGSPFEHSALTFFVHAPIFVWREWHRHRIASYNEESARYKPLDPVFWVPRRDRAMVPVEGWKPGRPKFMTLDTAVSVTFDVPAEEAPLPETADRWYAREIDRKRRAYEAAYSAYLESLDDGIALEVARSVLPVGIYSSCWVTINPRSLMNFLSLRTHEADATFVSHPQAEIEEAARACEAVLAEGWPITHRAFIDNGRVGP